MEQGNQVETSSRQTPPTTIESRRNRCPRFRREHTPTALSRFLIEVQAALLPPRHLRRDPGSFTPDREGLVSTFSVFRSCDEMTAGIEGVVRRRANSKRRWAKSVRVLGTRRVVTHSSTRSSLRKSQTPVSQPRTKSLALSRMFQNERIPDIRWSVSHWNR